MFTLFNYNLYQLIFNVQETGESPSGTLRTTNSSSSRNSSKMNTIAGSAKIRVNEDGGPNTIHSRHQTTKLPQIPNSIA